ncbi:outer membrane protein, multidrug efflux system [Verrucomicrobium sp. GAS474]|uniref:efflux transporter outer membrane subunit n=1 Tax=Verrucomicrobium sp. GAS474 TaxID=1882831 RepID=UPI00087CF6A4|nr:efflux transporter outer membrane subunit [Verrucomicrobium sp. GAS474]SDU06201.1 outer membrane protein, multidrug efflux system [Verrucomicrobium sp. GAS474]
MKAARFLLLPALASALALAGCAVGPDYRQPDLAAQLPAAPSSSPSTPSAFTDANGQEWRTAAPADEASRGPWWTRFNDPELDRIEAEVVARNQDLRAALARVDQARATARMKGAAFLPEVDANGKAERERLGANTPQLRQFSFPGVTVPSATLNSFTMTLDLSYEVDLWGRVRRSFESARAQAQASQADAQNVLLSVTTEAALDYFALRRDDASAKLLRETLDLRKRGVQIAATRLQAGRVTALDVAQAKTEEANAEADLAEVLQSRAQNQNAIAYLSGKPATDFALAENPALPAPPEVPVGLPSSLLERRPDVARAERLVMAKNAEIGVAKAAFFPALSLTGQGGYLSYSTNNLFTSPSQIWSIGPSLSLPLFAGGRNAANLRDAKAAWEEATATYRGAVLGAVRDVENALVARRYLGDRIDAVARAAAQADEALRLTEARYKSGEVSYFDVIEAQRTALGAKRGVAEVSALRLQAAVTLIKALGGGWGEDSVAAR